MLDITEVKNYIRVDDEDNMVLSLMASAKSYMAGAIDNFDEIYANANDNWKAKADLAMKLLIADWYENRTPVGRPSNSTIQLLLAQLQLEGGQNG